MGAYRSNTATHHPSNHNRSRDVRRRRIGERETSDLHHIFGVCVIVVGLIPMGACQTDPLAAPSNGNAAEPTAMEIRGTVNDDEGSVASAVVRIQATTNETLTDDEGRFTLTDLMEGATVTVSAWKAGYYCEKVENVTLPADSITLTLRRYQTNDNPAYEWLPPTGEESCITCKPDLTQIWLENAHAGSATNARFLTMYNGTDVDGNQSPPTRHGYNKDYGSFPLRPDPDEPYYGPGYKLDFLDTAGNCAACHVPGAAVDAAYGIDPNEVTGVNTFGVHCDFCHKVADVTLDAVTELPAANMPGVLSMDIRRPFPDDPDRPQLFFGSFDDVNAPEADTYLPLVEESRFCAPCHFGVFWDVVIYNSYGEWLESPYSDAETGKTCQQCHMPSPAIVNGEQITSVAPANEGGIERDPLTIHAHSQPGAKDEELLQNAVTLTASGRFEEDTIVVQVDITNDQTGHDVPTDSPLRHMILLVQATDAEGNTLEQTDGETIPEWCGVCDLNDGCYAGLPGKAYAKVLEELWTEVSPTGAYWNLTRLLSDNRLAAFATDTSVYTFAAPAEGDVIVEATLLFRRAFYELARQKGWDVPDILMEQTQLTVPEKVSGKAPG